MGIRGLTRYLAEHVRGHRTELISHLKAHGEGGEGDTAAVIIDGMSLVYHLYQSVDAAPPLSLFLDPFLRQEITTIVVLDGVMPASKKHTKINRVKSQIQSSMDVAESLSAGKDLSRRSLDFLPLLHVDLLISQLLLLQGRAPSLHLHVSLYEADNDIASIASRYKYSVLLSNDSDFLVFPFDLALLHHVNTDVPGEVYCTLVNRQAVTKSLHVPGEAMPIFACLVGNDYIEESLSSTLQKLVVDWYKRQLDGSKCKVKGKKKAKSKRQGGQISSETIIAASSYLIQSLSRSCLTGEGGWGGQHASVAKMVITTVTPPSLSVHSSHLVETLSRAVTAASDQYRITAHDGSSSLLNFDLSGDLGGGRFMEAIERAVIDRGGGDIRPLSCGGSMPSTRETLHTLLSVERQAGTKSSKLYQLLLHYNVWEDVSVEDEGYLEGEERTSFLCLLPLRHRLYRLLFPEGVVITEYVVVKDRGAAALRAWHFLNGKDSCELVDGDSRSGPHCEDSGESQRINTLANWVHFLSLSNESRLDALLNVVSQNLVPPVSETNLCGSPSGLLHLSLRLLIEVVLCVGAMISDDDGGDRRKLQLIVGTYTALVNNCSCRNHIVDSSLSVPRAKVRAEDLSIKWLTVVNAWSNIIMHLHLAVDYTCVSVTKIHLPSFHCAIESILTESLPVPLLCNSCLTMS